MTAGERGVLLLCCALGQPEARPLTAAQFRDLGRRVLAAGRPAGDGPVRASDLEALGVGRVLACRAAALLDREAALERYLDAAAALGIFPLTRVSPGYPRQLTEKGGALRPPVLFCAGDRRVLEGPFLGLAGARDASPAALDFAARTGALAARQGLTLVTGGARGADRAAVEACQAAGGRTLTFVPDDLIRRAAGAGPGRLVCSEGGYELAFTAQRALARNTLIHRMGERTVAIQPGFRRGGTWSGAAENLRRGWSRLYVYDDGSAAAALLVRMGASALPTPEALFDPLPVRQRG